MPTPTENDLRLHLDEGGAMPVAAAARDASTALAPATAAPLTTTSRPPVAFGLTPRTIDEAWRFAQMLAASDMVPKDYRGKPENCMVAMQYGAEVGLAPMASLQSIAVINGRPGLFGDGFLAVVMATPAYAAHQECYLVAGEERERVTTADLTKDDTAALARFWRKGRAEPFVAMFSIADARKASLLGKAGPWTEYPARMLRFRAREFAARDGFAAELRGMQMAEALRDAVDPSPTIIPIAAPQRRSIAGAVASAPAADESPADEPPEPDVSAPPHDDPPTVTTPTTRERSSDAPSSTRTPSTAGDATSTASRVVIENTAVLQRERGSGYDYEVTATQVGVARQPPVGHVFITPDEALYRVAVSCEGTGVPMIATWHRGKRSNGVVVKLLDALTAED